MDKMTKDFSADISIDDGERAIIATMTTSTVDRDGEVLQPQGMNAVNFQKNPVVMLQHNYYTLPIGKVTAIKRGQGKWSAKIIPAERPDTLPADQEWVPDTIYSLFKQGVLGAVSVGLIPLETRPANDKDVETFGAGVRRVVSKWELLELSVCAIPCNPDAVATAVGKAIITQEVADKLFGKIEPKAEPKAEDKKDDMLTCSECGKEFPPNEMQGEPPMCAECYEAAKSAKHVTRQIAPKEESAGRHVVKTIEEKQIVIKHIHKVLSPIQRELPIRKMVMLNIAKRRGRIYE